MKQSISTSTIGVRKYSVVKSNERQKKLNDNGDEDNPINKNLKTLLFKIKKFSINPTTFLYQTPKNNHFRGTRNDVIQKSGISFCL